MRDSSRFEKFVTARSPALGPLRAWLVAFMIALLLLLASPVLGQYTRDPLPSWNEGPAKQAILDFVAKTTKEGGPDFVPYDERIAVFDQDGTLWVEHPMYTQVLYCLSRVPAVVKEKPELKDKEPFKTVLSGDKEAMEKLALKDWEEIVSATMSGMPVDQFQDEVKTWLKTAK